MKTVREGASGSSVKLLQERLNANGFGPLATDGAFGPATEEAVEQYQAANALVADGIVGPATWAKLMAGEPVESPADALRERKAELEELAQIDQDWKGRSAVQHAISFLGAKEVPNGSNIGPDLLPLVGGYCAYWGISPDRGFPWCAMFVSTTIGMGLNLGTSSASMDWESHPFGKFLGGVRQIMTWGIEAGCYFGAAEGKPARTGDVFIMGRKGSGSDASASLKSGHTGLVVAEDGDYIVTIEGNASNAVSSVKRKRSSLVGFVRWSSLPD